jgi:hypothetical protein
LYTPTFKPRLIIPMAGYGSKLHKLQYTFRYWGEESKQCEAHLVAGKENMLCWDMEAPQRHSDHRVLKIFKQATFTRQPIPFSIVYTVQCTTHLQHTNSKELVPLKMSTVQSNVFP